MKFKCYDTCSLLEQAGHLFASDDYTLVITSITLEELEHIKTASNKDADVKFAARKVLIELDEHYGSFEIVLYNDLYGEKMLKDGISLTNDAKIIACARHFAGTHPEDEIIFVTNDLICRHIASMYFTTEKVVEEEYDYDGYKEVVLDDNEMTEFYSNPEANLYDLHINEYLLVYNTDGECVDRLCWTGNGYRHLSYNSFNSRWFGDVKPMKGDVYQSLAADSLMNNKITLVKGPAGSGKAQPNSTLIPTKNGYIKLGDIQVGDKVLDRFGKETTVLAVYPQGLKDNYKITFSDGRESYCNDEHLWSCYTSKGNLKEFTVKEMIENGLQQKCGDWKYKIPINQPVEFPQKDYPIDPYVIGVFLGDGCCLENALTLSGQDEEIICEVSKLIGAKEYSKSCDKNYSWNFYFTEKSNIKGAKCRILTRNLFKDFIQELCTDSANKRIPEIYKLGSIEQRFNLLQGLMDTDGSIDNENKGRTRFTSINLSLIQDIQEICWSLGMSASISKDNRSEKYKTGICYTLTISCDKEFKPLLFRLKRKKDIAIAYANNNKKSIHSNKLTIKNIEKMPTQEEMTCILVDNKEHLYLTEQYIPTHNTFLSLAFLMHKLEKNKIDKIIVFCNTVATKNSAKLGYYPGTRDEKLLDSQIGNLLISKFGGRLAVEQMIQQEKLVLLPLSDIRGYDTSGMCAGIYISEAQNMDVELMKLTLQRIGEDSICIIDGDCKTQVDDIHFSGSNNGMRRASQVYRGEDVYGEITLKNIHRSRIAQIAERL